MIGRTNVGGGGGSIKGTDAILRVIAPAGSTVTISKGGVSKTDLGHENASDSTLYDYYFVIHQSQFDSITPWLVSATLGGQVIADTIIIDMANEYDMVLNYLVPAEYQHVEYLEANGTQYIDSDISTASKFEMYVDAKGDDGIIVGSNQAAGGSGYRWVYAFNVGQGYRGYVGPNGGDQFFTNGTVNDRAQMHFKQTSGNSQTFEFTCNGTTETKSFTQTTSSGRSVWLFAYRGNPNWSYGTARIYRAQLYNSGSLVRDFVPCYRKADSVAGMWDRVGESFYTNDGTGTFVVGGDR